MREVQVITTAIICVVCFFGGLFALLSNYRRRPNRIVFYLTTIAALSLPAQGIFEFTDPNNLLFWARVDASATMILDFLILLLACNFPRRLFSYKIEVPFGIFALTMAVLSFSSLMISSGILAEDHIVQLTTGSLMPLYYIVDAIYTFLIIPAMIVQYVRGRKIDRLRIKYLLLGLGGIAILTTIVGLWLPIFFHIYEAANFVPFAILIGGAFIMYDVVALHLLNIRLVVARSVAYILLLIAVAGGYYFFALWIGQQVFGTVQISGVEQLYQVAIAFALAFLFQPIRIFFEKLTDRIFYKNHYDTQKVVSGFANILVSAQDIEQLLQRSISYLCENLHISSGQIVVYDKGQVFATASCHATNLNEAQINAINKLTDDIVVSEYLADEDPNRVAMEQSNVWTMAKLVSQNEQVGILLLGDKLSGDIYTSQDIGALQIVSQALAVAVQNARAYRLLQEAQASLKQTDAMKSEFIALSSHNLRTPIATISLATEMLARARSPQEISKYIEMLTGVSKELGDFVEELLTINSLEAGKQHMSFGNVTIDNLLQPLLTDAQIKAQAKGVAFNATFSNPNMLIKANAAQMRMVFRSLLENAVKFTQEGIIAVNTLQQTDKCIIKISDTGIGIAPEEIKNLFTKFHRGTDFKQYNYSGAGVGLYMAKLVVEAHGGHILVDSLLDKGTTVTIELPILS